MTKETKDTRHFRNLESMYKAAPINDFFDPQLTVKEGQAEILMPVKKELYHAGMAVHGCAYFKLLDDAAYFAANSLEPTYFVLTTSFTTYLTRPVSEGLLRAVGKVVNQNRTQFIAESVIYNESGKEIGRGNGIFVRSKNKLVDVSGYENNR